MKLLFKKIVAIKTSKNYASNKSLKTLQKPTLIS